MQTFKLVIDGHAAWTSLFIKAEDMRAAEKRAAEIAATCDCASFTLMIDGTAVASGRSRPIPKSELTPALV